MIQIYTYIFIVVFLLGLFGFIANTVITCENRWHILIMVFASIGLVGIFLEDYTKDDFIKEWITSFIICFSIMVIYYRVYFYRERI